MTAPDRLSASLNSSAGVDRHPGFANTKLGRIGRYILEEHLGGGMAWVYRAHDSLMNRTVALKILTPENAANPDARARFLREAQLGASVEHDHILRVYDFGEAGGETYLVMEFLRGHDLAKAMECGLTGNLTDRLKLLRQLASALQAVHHLGITHRDVKPANVHLDSSGRIRLMDFGIARSAQSPVTRTGQIIGTPSYMAPEQVSGKNINHLSDIYSFGVLAFELLCGTKPYEAETVEQLFHKILAEPPDFALLRAAGCPEAVVCLIKRCLAKAPHDRPHSASQIAKALTNFLLTLDEANRPEPGTRPVLSAPTVGHSGRRVWIAVLSVVLTLSIAAWITVRSQPSKRPDTFRSQGFSTPEDDGMSISTQHKPAEFTRPQRKTAAPCQNRQYQANPYHDEPFVNSPFQ